MKKLILIIVLKAALCNTGYMQTPPVFVDNLLFNYESQYNGEFSFSIYSFPSDTVYMGSSTYTIKVTSGVLYNPRLSYVNPKYTLGSPGYYPMTVKLYEAEGAETEDYISIQIIHLSGPGSMLEMYTQIGELIATVKCEIYQVTDMHLQYDPGHCFFINANPYGELPASWKGAYKGPSFFKE